MNFRCLGPYLLVARACNNFSGPVMIYLRALIPKDSVSAYVGCLSINVKFKIHKINKK